MNAGDAADQVIRQVDKMLKNNERASRDSRSGKVYFLTTFICLSHKRIELLHLFGSLPHNH